MNDSILLITSQDSSNKAMGTGFVVHSDEGGSFVLTCEHVLNDVKEPKIHNFEIQIIAKNHIYDLALFYIKDLHSEPLKLKEYSENIAVQKDVTFQGYRKFSKDDEYEQSIQHAFIISLNNNTKNQIHYDKWKIKAKENSFLTFGYSGSPLILHDRVIGIISNKTKLDIGFATSIKHLADLWVNMPLNLKPTNPFVGLRAFKKEDIKYFFGRDKEILEISSKLENSNLLAVVGDSGSGKSSVIKAGLIPFYESKGYVILEIRPANDPFIELKSEVGRIAKELHILSSDIVTYKKEINADNSYENIRSIVEQLFQRQYKDIFFYIDQFEELFTSYSDKAEENRNKFLELLLYLANNQSTQFHIKTLFTIRSDYYPLLKNYKIINHIEDNQEANKFIIKRMENDKLEETIYKPLISVDLVNTEEAKEFSEFVVNGMGSKDNEITLLQIAMTQTFNHFEESKDLFEAYRKVGSVSGALQQLATETMDVIANNEIVKTIFIRLIHFDKEKHNHTRRVADESEFSDEQWKFIQLLSSALNSKGEVSNLGNEKYGRLLKLSKEATKGKSQTVELVHEALITGWSMYSDWVIKLQYFKPLQDVLIAKTKTYKLSNKKHNFLLMGADLDELKSLLDSDYKKYLSEDEKTYLFDSKKNEEEEKNRSKMINTGLKVLVVNLVVLLGLSGYLWNEANKGKEQVITVLNGAVDGAVLVLEENNVSNVRIAMNPIIREFKTSTSLLHQEIVSKAWLLRANAFKDMNDYKNALKEYTELIIQFKQNKDSKVLNNVAKALYNKAYILSNNHDFFNLKEAIQTFDILIKEFKDNNSSSILETVAKGWVHKGVREKISTLESFIVHFQKSDNTIIKRELILAYNEVTWRYLRNNKNFRAIEVAKDGLSIRLKKELPSQRNLYINLAHAYAQNNQLVEAKKIYLKYVNTQYRKEIAILLKKDFDCLKMKNSFYNEILAKYK